MAWMPRDGETVVFYDPTQRESYETDRPSEYDPWAWPPALLVGRDNRADRCFPEVAVRAHFERCGYRVLLSAPKYPDELGFILFHFRRLRRANHPAFTRMQEHFPTVDLNQLAEEARRAKRDESRSGGGGDPDLFVFRPNSGERFFVDAKDADTLKPNQLVCFPIIEERLGCLVKVVRIKPITPRRCDASHRRTGRPPRRTLSGPR